MRNKIVEVEILKSEHKDLKETVQLEHLLKEGNEPIPNKDKTENNSMEEDILLQMKRSGFQRKSPQYEASNSESATNKNTKEPEYNCNECDYQGTRENDLKKHVDLKHRVPKANPKEREYNW